MAIRSYTNPAAPNVDKALSRFKREVSTIPKVTSATEDINRIRGNWDRGWSAFEGAVDTTRTAIKASNIERAKKAEGRFTTPKGKYKLPDGTMVEQGSAEHLADVKSGGLGTQARKKKIAEAGGVPSISSGEDDMRQDVEGYEPDTSEVDVQEQATDKTKPAWSKALDFGKRALKTVGGAAVVAGATAVNPVLGAAVVAGGGYKGLKRRRERQLQASIDKKREQFSGVAEGENIRAKKLGQEGGHEWEQMLTDEERKYMSSDKPSDTGEADSESFMGRFRDWSKETKQGFDEKASAKEQRKREADIAYTEKHRPRIPGQQIGKRTPPLQAIKGIGKRLLEKVKGPDWKETHPGKALKERKTLKGMEKRGEEFEEGYKAYQESDEGQQFTSEMDKFERESESYKEIMDLRAFEQEHMTNASPEDKETYKSALTNLEDMVKSGKIDRTQLKDVMMTLPTLKRHINRLNNKLMQEIDGKAMDSEQKQIFTDMYIKAEIAMKTGDVTGYKYK